ncbi:hypothetical protein HDE68_000379 [Pedobacter cryoconitis]|uniref:Uncharacterized protein n=1 Tax=Pedobacter cryoconitis TaxID=188932 RepID=A0A7W9DXS8_9SPHI|nr:hypothetical protein [Pedobacter cryoconitis]MBB5634494.1 hypothetical protein [Pedobacter cryoconitis]
MIEQDRLLCAGKTESKTKKQTTENEVIWFEEHGFVFSATIDNKQPVTQL